MADRKKVLFFTQNCVGGAERVSITIAKLLPRDKFEAKIVLVSHPSGNLTPFIPSYLEIINLHIRGVYTDLVAYRMYKLIKKEKPYAVFCSLMHLNVRLLFAAHKAHVPKIIIRTNIGYEGWRSITRFLARRTLKYSSYFISQTDEMKDGILKEQPNLEPISLTIPNPIDTESIDQGVATKKGLLLDASRINYIYSGRISPEKCIDVLIKAFKIVKETVPEAILNIIGDYNQVPSYKELLDKEITQLNLEDSVKFHGFQSNPYQYISEAQCFVLASRIEGYPNVLLEAMYLKIPVVATRSVPIIDRIVSPTRGFVVDVDDSEAIAKSMIKAKDLTVDQQFVNNSVESFINLFS